MKALQFAPGDRGLTRLLERLLKRVEEQHDQLDRLAHEMEVDDVVRGLDLSEERTILATVQQRAGDAVELQRQRALGKVLDELYFRVELSAAKASYLGAVTEVVNGDLVVMRFPKLAGTLARATFPAREQWVKTRPRVRVWYTSPVGSLVAFDFRFVLVCLGAGGTTANTVEILDWSAAGPAVANDVLLSSAVGVSRYPSSPFGVCHVLVGRRATDANAGDLDILLATVTFEEVA